MPTTTRPPGPRGTLLLGNLRDFVTRRLDFLAEVARRHGDLAAFRIGPRRTLLASHPDLVERVLVTDARHYVKHFGARMYKPVLGNGLVTSEGDFWLRQRKLSQPAFLKGRVLSYAPAMTGLAEKMLAGWADGERRDVRYEFSALTSAIALKTLFDLDDPGERETFNDAHREAFILLGERFRRPLSPPLWVPTPRNLRTRRAIAQLDRVVHGFIESGRARARARGGEAEKRRGGDEDTVFSPPLPLSSSPPLSQTGNDLLSRLLAAQDEDGSAMTDRQLRDEAMTLYLAGHETTALALSWSWYLLAQHPEAEERLAAEWQAVLGGRTPTPDDVPRLPFTEAVVTEAMRVYPPVYLIGREATCDLELGGYRVRRGTTVFMSQWVSHRDPRYFDTPEKFRPERWLAGLAHRLPKYAYYPFGGGPRVCIGNTFAMLEAVLLLATVGQRFRFTLEPDPPVELNPQITLLPKPGIPAVLRRRQ